MKQVEYILQSFQYNNCRAFICSLFPSIKYKATMSLFVVSSVLTTIAELLGMKPLTVIAFVVLCILELSTGIVASVLVKKEKFKSSRASRFTIKLASIMIVFFVLNTFYIQYKNSNSIASGFFEWLYIAVLIFFALEYLVSVLENVAVISGQSNNVLISSIRKKLNSILDLEQNETTV